MNWFVVIAYLFVIIAVPLSVYAISDGLRKQRSYTQTRVVFRKALRKAEGVKVVIGSAAAELTKARAMIERLQARIVELERQLGEAERAPRG